jgi:hypothetical protein
VQIAIRQNVIDDLPQTLRPFLGRGLAHGRHRVGLTPSARIFL